MTTTMTDFSPMTEDFRTLSAGEIDFVAGGSRQASGGGIAHTSGNAAAGFEVILISGQAVAVIGQAASYSIGSSAFVAASGQA